MLSLSLLIRLSLIYVLSYTSICLTLSRLILWRYEFFALVYMLYWCPTSSSSNGQGTAAWVVLKWQIRWHCVLVHICSGCGGGGALRWDGDATSPYYFIILLILHYFIITLMNICMFSEKLLYLPWCFLWLCIFALLWTSLPSICYDTNVCHFSFASMMNYLTFYFLCKDHDDFSMFR